VLRDVCRHPAASCIVINVGLSLLLVSLCKTFTVDPGAAVLFTLLVARFFPWRSSCFSSRASPRSWAGAGSSSRDSRSEWVVC